MITLASIFCLTVSDRVPPLQMSSDDRPPAQAVYHNGGLHLPVAMFSPPYTQASLDGVTELLKHTTRAMRDAEEDGNDSLASRTIYSKLKEILTIIQHQHLT